MHITFSVAHFVDLFNFPHIQICTVYTDLQFTQQKYATNLYMQ